MEKIKKIIEKIENQPINIEKWFVVFFAIVATRLFIELFLNFKESQIDFAITNSFIWHDFVHIFLIFLFFNLVSFIIFKKTLKLSFSKFLNISLFATLFLSIFPPVLDFLISQKHKMINFYEFYSWHDFIVNFFTFMQKEPLIGTTPGQRIGILFSLILIGFYSYLKTKKIKIVTFNIFIFYVLFYFISTLPSIITFFVKGFKIQSSDVAALFFSPSSFLNQETLSINISLHKKMIFCYLILILTTFFVIFIKNKIFQALLKNIRLTQTFYHIGLFLIGLGLAVIFKKVILINNFFNILALILIVISIVFSWFSSVIINDYFDKKIDKLTNQNRPLIISIISDKNYLKISFVLFGISFFILNIINPTLTVWFLFYYALTLIYNITPLRLKKFLGLATFTSALASLIIIIIGYLSIIPENSLKDFPNQIVYLILITFTICLPIKDFKDIIGDKESKIYTLPVVFGEKKGRFILGLNFFFSFLLSVYFLKEPRLFFTALIFGIFSFLVLNLKNKNGYTFDNRKITFVIFGLVFIYGLILIKLIFGEILLESLF